MTSLLEYDHVTNQFPVLRNFSVEQNDLVVLCGRNYSVAILYNGFCKV